LGSGPAISTLAALPQAKLLALYDPVLPTDRAEGHRLRDLLAEQLRLAHRDDLIEDLDNGQESLLFKSLPGVDPVELRRYLRLVGGDERRAYALYLFPPTTW
jgi:hypothetical protein